MWAECPKPPSRWPCHVRPRPCPTQPGGRDPLTGPVKEPVSRSVGWGGLWKSLECPCAAGQRLLPTPPTRMLCEVAAPEGTLMPWSPYTVQQCPRRRQASGAPPRGGARPGPRPPSQERPASSGGLELGWPSDSAHGTVGLREPRFLPCPDRRSACAGERQMHK